jgi:hypothetical protein
MLFTLTKTFFSSSSSSSSSSSFSNKYNLIFLCFLLNDEMFWKFENFVLKWDFSTSQSRKFLYLTIKFKRKWIKRKNHQIDTLIEKCHKLIKKRIIRVIKQTTNHLFKIRDREKNEEWQMKWVHSKQDCFFIKVDYSQTICLRVLFQINSQLSETRRVDHITQMDFFLFFNDEMRKDKIFFNCEFYFHVSFNWDNISQTVSKFFKSVENKGKWLFVFLLSLELWKKPGASDNNKTKTSLLRSAWFRILIHRVSQFTASQHTWNAMQCLSKLCLHTCFRQPNFLTLANACFTGWRIFPIGTGQENEVISCASPWYPLSPSNVSWSPPKNQAFHSDEAFVCRALNQAMDQYDSKSHQY